MQLFTEDIVERKDGSGMGIVARSWQEQPEADIPAEIADDPLLRPLLKGEVGVQSYPSGHREILPESSFNLLDRTTFVRGDFCKRAYDDIQSGVVLNLKIQVKVQHAITMEPVDLWFDKDEFVANQPLMLGDFVFYNNWVGQVEEIFSEALMHQSDSKIQPVYGLGGRFAIGEKCYAMTEASPTIPPTLDESSDVIIKVMPIAAAISWSAINQRLDSTTGHELKRPPQLWASQELQDLVVMRSRGSVAGSIGERVVFKDPIHIGNLGIQPVLYKDHELNFEVSVDVMVIRLSRTRVEVLWQDGTREWVPATELIPHINPDEHECWPGDYVLWKGEDEKRIAIVQSVAAKERIATVRWYDTDTLEQVSVLDLDPHGPSLGEGGNLDAFGLRRGEFVLLHESFTGAKVPMVPRIGELEPWVHDQPSRTPEGTLEGWRGELTSMALKTFGLEYMQHDRPSQIRLTADTVFGQLSGNETNRILPRSDTLRTSSSDVVDWFGQVVDLTDSGHVIVSLPSSRLVKVPIHRCSLYRDIEDYQWDAESAANDDLGALYDNDDQMSLGSWEIEDVEERDDWGHMETDSLGHSHQLSSSLGQLKAFAQAQAVMPGSFDPRPPTPLSDDDDQITRVSSSPSEGKLKNSASKLSSSIEEVAMLLDDAQSHSGTSGNDLSEEDLQTNWKRFDVLPEAPADHAFFSVDPPQLSKQFLSRLAKEYRVLESTLPDTILVRAYEDRADLLRSLIIGPQNTPYQDAPFVIDWRLDGSFPQTPPIAHFLSWTNGNGRVNPNLYEEGKVCLSILGTWAGDRSESWSAARSSILQALVSIQGLVLVKEPYFCEPGFEKMRGTEEGRINSHLYSEKAYVLSRGFVRRALEIPLGGLEQEISWFYIRNGMLKKVLADSEQLISRSSSTADQDDGSAIPGLSAGGILALNRTLTKLRSLLHNLTAIQA